MKTTICFLFFALGWLASFPPALDADKDDGLLSDGPDMYKHLHAVCGDVHSTMTACGAIRSDGMTDQGLLANVAVKDKYWNVRCAAVEKLTDQALLAQIAVEDKKGYVRKAAEDALKRAKGEIEVERKKVPNTPEQDRQIAENAAANERAIKAKQCEPITRTKVTHDGTHQIITTITTTPGCYEPAVTKPPR